MRQSPVFLMGFAAIGIALSLVLAYYDWVPVELLTAQ